MLRCLPAPLHRRLKSFAKTKNRCDVGTLAIELLQRGLSDAEHEAILLESMMPAIDFDPSVLLPLEDVAMLLDTTLDASELLRPLEIPEPVPPIDFGDDDDR